MKYLVTGADGFIGSFLLQELKNRNQNILGLIQDTKANRNRNFSFDYKYWDLTNPNSINGICENIDIVIHLAAIPREMPMFTKKNYFNVNVDGTKLLLNEAKISGVKRFVFISTIEICGPAINEKPIIEKDVPHPTNNYGLSKLEAEKIVLDYNISEFETIIIRLPMLYGPNNFLNVPKLFKAVSKPIFPLFGSGKVLMEFCFVGNAVEGILLAANTNENSGGVFFITDDSIYLIDVILAVKEAVEGNAKILKIPISIAYLMASFFEFIAKILPFYPFRMKITNKPIFTRKTVDWTTKSINICSAKKAKQLLGYKSIYSLKQGLEITTKDFRNRNWI